MGCLSIEEALPLDGLLSIMMNDKVLGGKLRFVLMKIGRSMTVVTWKTSGSVRCGDPWEQNSNEPVLDVEQEIVEAYFESNGFLVRQAGKPDDSNKKKTLPLPTIAVFNPAIQQ